MYKAARFKTLLQYALCLLAFSIPLEFFFSSVCLAIVVILWILQGNLKKSFKRIKKRKGLWPWFIMYLLLIIAYFYSEDKTQAAFDLKTKLAYIILPLIIGAGKYAIDRRTVENIFASLIAGVCTAAVISLVNAVIIWYPEQYFYAFFYHQLVSIIDPNAVYMAWYTIFSISLLLFLPWQYHFQRGYKVLRVVAILFLLLFFILLSARMFMLLFLLFIIPYFIKRSFSNITRGIISTILILGAVYGLYHVLNTTNNPIKARYESMLNSDNDVVWLDDYSAVDEASFDNVTLRLFLWRLGLEAVVERNAWWAGVGNGDVHIVLREKMRAYKVQNMDVEDPAQRPGFYNANLHNMFIQNLVMLGIPGLIVFLFICVMPFFYIFKVTPYQPFLVFHISSILFMMQEAVLQTQAGIFFYIMMSSIFWSMFYNRKRVIFN